jgi:hypothetical protein
LQHLDSGNASPVPHEERKGDIHLFVSNQGGGGERRKTGISSFFHYAKGEKMN